MLALGKLAAVCCEDEREVGVFRPRRTDGFLYEHLARGIRYVVFSADDVRYLRFAIVHDDRKMEQRLTERLCDNEILELSRVERDVSADHVGPAHSFVGIAESHDLYLSTALFLRLARHVCGIFFNGHLEISRMVGDTVALAVLLTGAYPEPIETVADVFLVLGFRALAVRIFYAEEETSAVLPRVEVAYERCAGAPDVEGPRRRRSESSDNCRHRSEEDTSELQSHVN